MSATEFNYLGKKYRAAAPRGCQDGWPRVSRSGILVLLLGAGPAASGLGGGLGLRRRPAPQGVPPWRQGARRDGAVPDAHHREPPECQCRQEHDDHAKPGEEADLLDDRRGSVRA